VIVDGGGRLRAAFSGKTVLITGHTGFKGAWLTAWLQGLGARIVGVSLGNPTVPSHFDAAALGEHIASHRMDIRDAAGVANVIAQTRPDFVFHLAAQALVRRSYDAPAETWSTNVLGTLNVLEGLRELSAPCAAVIITSDKCYDNVEWVWGYRENDALGGPDPYSASKGAAELVIKSQVRSFFPDGHPVRVVSARAGNVIGGGDWASDRIVPDCVRAWSDGRSVELRRPHATRPWQHVLEPLSGYLSLAVELAERASLHGEAFNFGPQAQQDHSVLALVTRMADHWDQVRWEDVSSTASGPYESGLLKLNCDKALRLLGWHAALNFEETVKMTADWYRHFYTGTSATQVAGFTAAQIQEFTERANSRGLAWAQ
jgi:CDP-glucose 4,6-dehydratase